MNRLRIPARLRDLILDSTEYGDWRAGKPTALVGDIALFHRLTDAKDRADDSRWIEADPEVVRAVLFWCEQLAHAKVAENDRRANVRSANAVVRDAGVLARRTR